MEGHRQTPRRAAQGGALYKSQHHHTYVPDTWRIFLEGAAPPLEGAITTSGRSAQGRCRLPILRHKIGPNILAVKRMQSCRQARGREIFPSSVLQYQLLRHQLPEGAAMHGDPVLAGHLKGKAGQHQLPETMDAIPVVDLSVAVEQAAESIGRAARKSGFFYVKNHGISEDLLARQFVSSKAFFDQPLDQRLKLKINDALRFVQEESLLKALLRTSSSLIHGPGVQALFPMGRALAHELLQYLQLRLTHTMEPAGLCQEAPGCSASCISCRQHTRRAGVISLWITRH